MDASKVYIWSENEKEIHNTEKHQKFKNELYPHAALPKGEFAIKLQQFKDNHPEFF